MKSIFKTKEEIESHLETVDFFISGVYETKFKDNWIHGYHHVTINCPESPLHEAIFTDHFSAEVCLRDGQSNYLDVVSVHFRTYNFDIDGVDDDPIWYLDEWPEGEDGDEDGDEFYDLLNTVEFRPDDALDEIIEWIERYEHDEFAEEIREYASSLDE